MIVSIIALALFSLLCCLMIFYLYAAGSKGRDGSIRNELRVLIDGLGDAEKKINALVELSKVLTSQIPWWERSLSSIGVIAFVSMTLATTVQTTKSILTESKLVEVNTEMDELQSKIDNAESLIKSIADVTLKQRIAHGLLDEGGEEILEHRLASLTQRERMTDTEALEAYSIAMALGRYKSAVSIIEGYETLLTSTGPSDLVSLAEYYYLVGIEEKSSNMLADVMLRSEHLSQGAEIRAIILSVGLRMNIEKPEAIRKVQSILNVPEPKARQVVDVGLAALEEGRVKLRSQTE